MSVVGGDFLMGLAVYELKKGNGYKVGFANPFKENRKQRNNCNLLRKSIFHFHWCLMYITKIFALNSSPNIVTFAICTSNPIALIISILI